MKVCLTNGCFDILHAGHINLINFCKGLGGVVVALNTDESVRFLKGSGRPVIPFEYRKEALLALGVSKVIPLDSHLPGVGEPQGILRIIQRLRPDFYVKGEEYKGSWQLDLVESLMGMWGGKVMYCPRSVDISTTKILSN